MTEQTSTPQHPASIAVVIPLYNHDKYIEDTLESVLAQTRVPNRIVVVDDGSSDDSLAAARRVKDRRVEIHEQENQGAHAALNRAVKMAGDTCEFISILNSDDNYHTERIEKCLEHLEQNPDVSLLVTDLQLIDDNGDPLPDDAKMPRWQKAAWSRRESWQDGRTSLPEWLGLANFAMTTSNFFARADYLRAQPFRDYRYSHDYFALVHAAVTGKLGVLPEKLVQYRVHEKNTIKTDADRLTIELQRVHLDLMRTLAEPLAEHQEYRKRLGDYLRSAHQNISSFRMDIFLSLCAQLAGGYTEEELQAGLAGLNPQKFPELQNHPNTGIIDRLLEGDVSDAEAALAQEVKEVKRKLALKREQLEPARELARLRARITGSWSLNLGRVLGAGKKWARDEGNTPEEKLANLKKALNSSSWFKLTRPFEVQP